MFARILGWGWAALLFHSVAAAAPFLEGVVRDEQGRPVAGASVKIWDCVGTCFGGKTVLSDNDGHYVFEEKSFRNFPSLHVSMPGRYEVSRKETGPKLYEPDNETPRQTDFVLGTPAAAIISLSGDAPDGWTQTMAIRPGDDASMHRYDFRGNLNDVYSYTSFEVLPRREKLHLVVQRLPIVVAGDTPEETRKRTRESWRQKEEVVSSPIRLPDPQCYTIKARIHLDQATEHSYVQIDSIIDAVGTDRTKELLIVDPRFEPPASEEIQQQGLDLLQRLRVNASLWMGRLPESVESYEYDAINSKGERAHVRIDSTSSVGPAWADISRRRGFAYQPPLKWVFSQPENVVIHGLQIDGDRAMLDYHLKEKRGLAAGIGIGPWNGFFNGPFSTGTIMIDTITNTVVEHRLSRGGHTTENEIVEKFGDYLSVDSGFVPQSLRIKARDIDFRFQFRVHEGRLWLVDKSYSGDNVNPSFRMENVIVHLKK